VGSMPSPRGTRTKLARSAQAVDDSFEDYRKQRFLPGPLATGTASQRPPACRLFPAGRHINGPDLRCAFGTGPEEKVNKPARPQLAMLARDIEPPRSLRRALASTRA